MNSLLLAGLLVLPALAAPRNPDAFVTLLRNPWVTLDPAIAYDLGSFSILGNVYEALLSYDGSADKPAPWLAEKVPTVENGLRSADGRVFRFPIRKGVKFHLGGEMTPEDVRYSLLREMVLESPGDSASLLLRPLLGVDSVLDAKGRWNVDPKAFERALRVDGGSVVFTLRQPMPGFLQLIGSWPVVLSKSWAIAQGDWDGVIPKKGAPAPVGSPKLAAAADGTGPYRLVRADPGTTEALLERFDGYWGPRPKLSQAFFRSEPNDALRAAMLKDGEADTVYLERPTLCHLDGADGVRVLEGVEAYSSGETAFFTLALDPKKNPRLGGGKLDGKGIPPDFFADRDVRLGFVYAFDADAYLSEALSGKGLRAAGPLPERLMPGLGVENPYRYDKAQAEAAFRRAHGGKVWEKGFRLTVAYPRGSQRRQIAAELLKKGVEALNPSFKLDLEALEPGAYEKEYQAHRLPVFIHALTADFPDARALASQFLHSSGYFARAQGLRHAELDRVEEAAAVEQDPVMRRKLYAELTRRALTEAFQLYTFHPVHFQALRSWVTGTGKSQSVNGLGFNNLLYLAPLGKE